MSQGETIQAFTFLPYLAPIADIKHLPAKPSENLNSTRMHEDLGLLPLSSPTAFPGAISPAASLSRRTHKSFHCTPELSRAQNSNSDPGHLSSFARVTVPAGVPPRLCPLRNPVGNPLQFERRPGSYYPRIASLVPSFPSKEAQHPPRAGSARFRTGHSRRSDFLGRTSCHRILPPDS